MIACEVLADSIGPSGKRLTTVLLSGFWKLLQAELNTHRMLSRSSASSRAIPNEKIRQRIINDPAMPVFWGANQKGMAAAEELAPSKAKQAKDIWIDARNKMMMFTDQLAELGLHKQLCNRLLEPWMPTSIIISATEWENFFALRCHPAAQPEFRVAAEAIRDAMAASTAKELKAHEWHLPLVRLEDFETSAIGTNTPVRGTTSDPKDPLIKLSTARCARVSYLTHDGIRDPQADFELYERLVSMGHWAPLEHVAEATHADLRIGNFIGWRQHRAYVDPNFIH